MHNLTKILILLSKFNQYQAVNSITSQADAINRTLYLLVTLYKVSKCFRSSLVKLSERGLFVLMHMSGSMCIAQQQGLVNGSESLCNKLQEQSLRVVGMLTLKIMHPPLARRAFMIILRSCLQVRQRSELTLVSEI